MSPGYSCMQTLRISSVSVLSASVSRICKRLGGGVIVDPIAPTPSDVTTPTLFCPSPRTFPRTPLALLSLAPGPDNAAARRRCVVSEPSRAPLLRGTLLDSSPEGRPSQNVAPVRPVPPPAPPLVVPRFESRPCLHLLSICGSVAPRPSVSAPVAWIRSGAGAYIVSTLGRSRARKQAHPNRNRSLLDCNVLLASMALFPFQATARPIRPAFSERGPPLLHPRFIVCPVSRPASRPSF